MLARPEVKMVETSNDNTMQEGGDCCVSERKFVVGADHGWLVAKIKVVLPSLARAALSRLIFCWSRRSRPAMELFCLLSLTPLSHFFLEEPR